VDEVIAENPAEVERFKGGDKKLTGFFVGQVMKKSKGKANPGLVNSFWPGNWDDFWRDKNGRSNGPPVFLSAHRTCFNC
jgi:hypothetical protein